MLSAPVEKWTWSHCENRLFLFPQPPPSSGCRGPHSASTLGHPQSRLLQEPEEAITELESLIVIITINRGNRGKAVITEAKGHIILMASKVEWPAKGA